MTSGGKNWFEQVESERSNVGKLPEPLVIESEGKTIRIEYRQDEKGTIFKTTKTYRVQKIRVLPIVAERKKWKKFGDAAKDSAGINMATTKVDDDITMQFISSKEDEKKRRRKNIERSCGNIDKSTMSLL